jgi:hypothetical protein
MQYFLYKRRILSRLCLAWHSLTNDTLVVRGFPPILGFSQPCKSGVIFNRLASSLVEYPLPNADIIANMFVFWVLYQRMERTLTKSLESIQKVG